MMALSQRIQALEHTNVHSANDGLNAQVIGASVQGLENHVNGVAGVVSPGTPGLTHRIVQLESRVEAMMSQPAMHDHLDKQSRIHGEQGRDYYTCRFCRSKYVQRCTCVGWRGYADTGSRSEWRVIPQYEGEWPQRDAFDQQIKQEVKIEESK